MPSGGPSNGLQSLRPSVIPFATRERVEGGREVGRGRRLHVFSEALLRFYIEVVLDWGAPIRMIRQSQNWGFYLNLQGPVSAKVLYLNVMLFFLQHMKS